MVKYPIVGWAKQPCSVGAEHHCFEKEVDHSETCPVSTCRASEEAFVKESKEETPGTEWEKVAQLCDFNPKSSKQCKDVSRLRSVLMSLKQTPLSR